MPAIHFTHVTFGYTTAVDVLRDVTLHLGPGWTGVVGGNGSGKTTLLRLIAGELHPEPESGVTLDPADALVVTCAQEVEACDPSIVHLAASWDPHDAKLRGTLNLQPVQLDRWATLSPGERKRWQVGAALAADPDVLLLDEPTNHLDEEGRTWLLAALGRFDGIGLVVSHDRTLLEELTTQTIRVHRGDATVWGSHYSVAHHAWTAAEQYQVADYQRLRREHKKLERRVADQRRTAEAKRAEFARQKRTTDFKDIDARSAAATSVYRGGEKAAARILATAVSARERASEQLEAITITKDVGRALFVDFEPAPKPDLAVVRGDLAAAGHVLIPDLAAVIRRKDRIWLRGRNGVGKTTLLEEIRRNAAVPEDKLLYLPQELTADDAAVALDTLRSMATDERGRLLSVVAALGVDPDVLLATERPSPGEARKLVLAMGLGDRAWLLLLDEPTNHLDLPSIERLETALAAYPGAMVVVTHDEEFGRAIDLTEWTIADRALQT